MSSSCRSGHPPYRCPPWRTWRLYRRRTGWSCRSSRARRDRRQRGHAALAVILPKTLIGHHQVSGVLFAIHDVGHHVTLIERLGPHFVAVDPDGAIHVHVHWAPIGSRARGFPGGGERGRPLRCADSARTEQTCCHQPEALLILIMMIPIPFVDQTLLFGGRSDRK